jgi:hypothetical protein
MSKHIFPTDLLEQAVIIQDAWARIDSGLKFGSLDMGALLKDIGGLRAIESDLVSMENQMKALRNQRDALKEATWDKVKRVRAGVKGVFGDDSSEYELVGGTRLSERKTAGRTQAPVP